jgi:hypothetical protein
LHDGRELSRVKLVEQFTRVLLGFWNINSHLCPL